MPDSQVEEIKSKIDIVSIIGEHVKLNKSGSNFKGLCPFHQEKTPSFMVSEELQIYKCFGCGEGGDVFTFLEKYEGMEFPEALKFLAEKAGVALSSTQSKDFSEKEVLFEINTLGAKFYNFLLVNHPIGKVALNYLKEERKINEDSIKTFNIGFAPRNKNAFSDFLIKKKKMKVKDIEKAGVIFVSKGGRIYDRFEGRIIFPISDHRGNAIALAGRLLPPGKPNVGKYINSPQTPTYNKSASLYGLSVTKDFIKKSGFAVVVEGEIDLISSFQIGVKNIVAIKGSAFTEDQARLLGRYTKEIVLALDSDFAGINASLHGIKILQNLGFDIKVAKLGKYKDPDEAARGNPEFFQKAINNAVPIWDFIIESSLEKFDVNTISGKTKIGNFLTPFLGSIENKIVQSHYAKKVANLLSVDTSAVLEEVEKSAENEKKPEEKVETKKGETKTRREVLEERFIGLILRNKPALSKNEEVKSVVETPILIRLCNEFNGDPKTLPSELFDKYAEFSLLFSNDNDAEIKNEINEIFKQLKILGIKEKMDKIIKSSESKKSKSLLSLSKELKEFNSGEFKRIIS